MNFILALFIYSMILFTWGDSYIALKDMTYGMKFNEQAKEIGFRDGDILLSADGEELTRFNGDMIRSIVEAREVTVLRDGEEKQILMPELSLLDVAQQSPMFVSVFQPNVVDSVIAGGGFAQAGIQKGDSLVAFNGTEINSWNEFLDQMNPPSTERRIAGKDFGRVHIGLFTCRNTGIQSMYRRMPASR